MYNKNDRIQFIIDNYVNGDMSRKELADHFRLTEKGMVRYLFRHRLGKRLNLQQYRNFDWLYDKYIIQGKTSREIAQSIGVVGSAVCRWLKEVGIETRTPTQSKFINYKNKCNFTPEIEEFITGELLGDGSLVSNCDYTAYYSHGSKYKEYIQYLIDVFAEYDIEMSGNLRSNSRKDDSLLHAFVTRTYKELKPLHNRFYPSGKKIVPLDLKLTPITVRQWYIGDGTFSNHIEFATNGFSECDVDFLITKILELGITATKHKGSKSKLDGQQQYTIGISAYDNSKFFQFIGDCSCKIKDIYGYKWKKPIKDVI